MTSAKVIYDRTGRSNGEAEVRTTPLRACVGFNVGRLERNGRRRERVGREGRGGGRGRGREKTGTEGGGRKRKGEDVAS